jgi:hypothetical protein
MNFGAREVCQTNSTDPAKHSGPFVLESIRDLKAAIVSSERCLACNNIVLRVPPPDSKQKESSGDRGVGREPR